MATRLKWLLAPPVFEDEDQTRIAALLNAILLTVVAFAVIYGLTVASEVLVIPATAAIIVALGALVLLRLRRLRLAGVLFTSLVWAIIMATTLFSGGLRYPGFALTSVVVIIASVLLGGRAGLAFAAMTLLLGLGMVYAEGEGLLPPARTFENVSSIWLIYAAHLAMTVTLLHLGNRSTMEALERTRAGQRFQAEANRRLREEIAAREATEKRLKSSEERFKMLFEFAPDAYYLSDLKGVLVDGNRAAERLTGYSREELIGGNFLKLGLLALGEVPKAAGLLAKNALGVPTGPDTLTLTRKDGSPVIVEVSSYPIKIEDQSLVLGIARDVTERARMQEELDRLARFPSENPNPVLRISQEGMVLYANRPGQAFLEGCGCGIGRIVGSHCSQLVQAALEHGAVQWVEMPCQDRLFNLMITPIAGAGYANIYGLDITERKRGEQALRDSEARNRTIIAAIPDLIFRVNDEGAFLDFVPAAGQETYVAPEAFLGKRIPELMPPDVAEAQMAALRRTLDTGSTQVIEYALPLPDGARWYEARLAVCGETEVLAIARDITERKRAEEALQHSEERYRGLFQDVPAGLYRTTPTGEIVDANPALVKMLGYPDRESLLSVNAGGLCVSPEERQREHDILERDGIVHDFEMCLRRRDGQTIWVQDTCQAIRDGDGRMLFNDGSLQDITARRRAEEQLRRTAAELERSNEEIRNFAYIVSHDLRAPLVNLKGFSAELRSSLGVVDAVVEAALPALSEVQRQDVSLALQEDVPEALGFIESSVDRMDKFISAVLQLSRLGHRELVMEPLNVSEIVRATLDTLAHQIEEQGVKVEVRPLPEAVADRTSMEQIVGNLLSNAIKFVEPGRPSEIVVSGERQEDKVVYQVRDNGRGIAQEDWGKVFMPFRRAGRQDLPGEGVGLSYVEMLVRRHGGRIWFESELGVGTTFSFTLPNHTRGKDA